MSPTLYFGVGGVVDVDAFGHERLYRHSYATHSNWILRTKFAVYKWKSGQTCFSCLYPQLTAV